MPVTDLSFYTTQELVAELMGRTTFLGVVVHSEEEFRGRTWGNEKTFKVHLNANLGLGEAGRLLDVVAQHIDRRANGIEPLSG